MPRGPVVFTLPPGTTPQSPGDTIQSAVWNAAMDDIAQTLNTIQPKEYGGTGSSDLSLNATDLRVKDGTDTTKRIAFNASSITTATTRTITMGDADVTLRPQALEQIYKSTFLGVTSIPITNLSGYRKIFITGSVSGSSAFGLGIQVSLDGITYRTNSDDYRRWGSATVGSATPVSIDATGSAYYLNSVQNTAVNETCNPSVDIDNQPGGRIVFKTQTLAVGSTSSARILTYSGADTNFIGTFSSLRLVPDSGQSLSGWILVQGVRA